jgi:hypothetical protein
MAHMTNNGMPPASAGPPPVDYVAGLDLGTLVDHSALALLERTWRPDAQRRLRPHFYVRGLRRWPLLTGYPDIVSDVCAHFEKPPVRGCPLVVDHTGPGVPLVDMLRQANPPCRVVPVSITAGHDVTPGKRGGWNVPKKLLVGALQVLLQTGRLLIAPVKLRDVLARELANFKVKLTASANETYESARESEHDDLVLSVAIGCWYGQRPAPGRPAVHGVQVVEFREPPRSDDGPFGGNLW